MVKRSYRVSFWIILSLLLANGLSAQDMNRVRLGDYERINERKIIHIPDIPGYVTLKGDFHSHTIFSDGHVWPEFRIREAWREGLDVIAITDHIEVLPHKNYTVGDHNTSHNIAASSAEMKNIILIKGTEITRSMPPGHFNALFLEDTNPVENRDPMAQLEEANKQGAFVIWNHPGWDDQQPDTTMWWDYHTTLLEKGWLHGVEVVNSGEWYPVAMDWCRDKDLTVIANSDIHLPVDFKYDLTLPHSHRPMTLVFARDRSEEGVKEALFSRRTVAFAGEQLMGAEDLLLQLFNASVNIHPPFLKKKTKGRMMVYRELENPTDLTFILEEAGKVEENGKIRLNPRSIQILSYPAGKDELKYLLVNCWTGSREHPVIKID
jgi:hypothetical protein